MAEAIRPRAHGAGTKGDAMIRPLPLLGALALAAFAAPATAQTETAQAPAAQAAPPLSEIIQGFEERGYRLTDIDIDSDVIEIEGLDPDGVRIEARVDPATGEVLSESPED